MKMTVFWVGAPCSLVDISEVLSASIIALIMEAVRTSETSVNFYQTTRRYNPEDSRLHTRRREKLKSNPPPFFRTPFIKAYIPHTKTSGNTVLCILILTLLDERQTIKEPELSGRTHRLCLFTTGSFRTKSNKIETSFNHTMISFDDFYFTSTYP
jgi:hypothetical protein